jgi:hypothetical protein
MTARAGEAGLPRARGEPARGRADQARPAELLVSIVNYRTAEMTIAALRSVLADRGGIDLRVAVVDNRSGDGSAEAIADWIAARDPPVPVELLRSATNSGFSGGHNRGIAAGAAEFYLLLNSDAELRPGCLAALLAAARAAPGAGLVAPRLEHADGQVQTSSFRDLSPASEVIRGAGSGPVTRLLSRFEVALGPDPGAAPIGWVSFAAALIRAEALAAAGPMDEGYFLYFEDADYCRRLRAAGWDIARAPRARVVHHRGGSAPVKALAAARRRLPAYYYAARTRYFRLAHGRLGPLAANLGWHLGRLIAQGRRLFGKPVPPAVEAEWRDIWTNFADPLGDRRAPED